MSDPIVIPIPDHPVLTDAARNTIGQMATVLTLAVLDGVDFYPMIVQPGNALTATMAYDGDDRSRASQTFLAALALHDRLHPDEVVWCADAYVSHGSLADLDDMPPPCEDPQASDTLMLGYVRVVDDGALCMFTSMPYHRDDKGVIVWDTPDEWRSVQPAKASPMQTALVAGATGMPIDAPPTPDILTLSGIALIEREAPW